MQRKRQAQSSGEHHHMNENSESESESENFCLSDNGLSSLANGCKGLEKLSLIWCSSISSLGLRSIAENCRFLKSLDLQVQFYCLCFQNIILEIKFDKNIESSLLAVDK